MSGSATFWEDVENYLIRYGGTFSPIIATRAAGHMYTMSMAAPSSISPRAR